MNVVLTGGVNVAINAENVKLYSEIILQRSLSNQKSHDFEYSFINEPQIDFDLNVKVGSTPVKQFILKPVSMILKRFLHIVINRMIKNNAILSDSKWVPLNLGNVVEDHLNSFIEAGKIANDLEIKKNV